MNAITRNVDVIPDGCWIWTAYLDRRGYGRLRYNGKPGLLASRVSYEIHVGPIPERMTIDHLCFTPACVNPAHLRLLTLSENSANRRDALKRFCKQGHEFTPENTYHRPDSSEGKRGCRTCQREAVARYKARVRSAA